MAATQMKMQRSLPAAAAQRSAAVSRVRLVPLASAQLQQRRAWQPAAAHAALRVRAPAARRPIVSCRAEQAAAASEVPPEEEEDFDLLSTKVAELVKEVDEELRGCSIYLVGMMGCGKSTLGKMLANTLKYKFFDSDTMVELAHDKKSVADIFKEYGQDYFRDCESTVCGARPVKAAWQHTRAPNAY